MRNMVVMRRILVGALAVLAQTWFVGQVAAATFEFSSPSSKLVLGDYNGGNGSSRLTSRFRTTAPNSVIGWDQQSIVRGSSTSNVISWAWTTSLGFATHSESSPNPGRDLLLTTSDALNKHWPTLRTTSNWVNRQFVDLNASNVGQILRGTTNWVNNQYVALDNNAALGQVARTTSNFVNAHWPTLRTTSNWVNAQYDALGDSRAGYFLRTTSNAITRYAAGQVLDPNLVRTTSNWVAKQVADLGGSQGLGLMVRATSNWIVEQDLDFGSVREIGEELRTTSNAVNSMWPILRTSSNWIAIQAPDLGDNRVGEILRGTSNWVIKQVADLGISTIGEQLRTTSNSLVYAHRRVNAVEGDLSGVHATLRTIDAGVGDVSIPAGTSSLSYDLMASGENKVIFGASATVEGKGHVIDLTNYVPTVGAVLKVDAGAFVTMYNTIFKRFNPNAILISGVDPTFGRQTRAAQARLTIADGSVIELGQDITLNRDIVCTGNVVIKGYGCKIDFAGYSIRIGKGVRGEKGKITFEDVVLDNVKTDSILVAENTDSVVLRDARVNLSAPCTFGTGALRVERQVVLTGQNVFSFTSAKTLTVGANATLTLAANSSFVYAPSTGSRTALVLEDATSELVLGGCFFYAPAPGLQLTTGVLTVLSNNNLYNVGATSLDEAITLGDGTAAGDLLIDIQPGATLNIIEGKLDYKSV